MPANSTSNQPATVMPAQAGIQTVCLSRCFWIPAFAGMTNPKPHRNWRAKTGAGVPPFSKGEETSQCGDGSAPRLHALRDARVVRTTRRSDARCDVGGARRAVGVGRRSRRPGAQLEDGSCHRSGYRRREKCTGGLPLAAVRGSILPSTPDSEGAVKAARQDAEYRRSGRAGVRRRGFCSLGYPTPTVSCLLYSVFSAHRKQNPRRFLQLASVRRRMVPTTGRLTRQIQTRYEPAVRGCRCWQHSSWVRSGPA